MKFNIKKVVFLLLVITLSYNPTLFLAQTLDELEAEIEQIKEDTAEKQAEQENIETEKIDTEADITEVNSDIQSIKSDIADMQSQIDSKNAEIEAQKGKIAEIQAQIPEAKDETGSMLRVMQKADNSNVMVQMVLTPTENEEDNILRRMDSVNSLTEYAGGVVIDLVDLEQELQYEKTVLDKQKAELDQQEVEMETQKKTLEAKEAELKTVLASQTDAISDLDTSVESAAEDQAMLEDTLAYYESIGCSGGDAVGSKCGDLADDDGDGVNNGNDSCPNESGTGSDGCPVVVVEEPEDDTSSGNGNTSSGNGNTSSGNGNTSSGGGAETASAFARPLSHGVITTEFGGYDGHTGTDMDYADYTPILATAPGTVISTNTSCAPFADGRNTCGGGYGNYVMLMHDTANGVVFSLYGHMSSVSVSPGQTVSQGQQVGLLGDSGNSDGSHLHFEVWADANGNGLPDDAKTDARYYVSFPAYGVWW